MVMQAATYTAVSAQFVVQQNERCTNEKKAWDYYSHMEEYPAS